MDAVTEGRTTLIYDDDCGFCRWAVERILAWDRAHRVRPLALRTDEADHLLAHLPIERRRASWHLVTPDGAVRSGGAGAAPLLRRLPGGALLARAAETMPGPTDALYRLVARHRASLGRLLGRERCAVRPVDRATSDDGERSGYGSRRS
jgi:predicted DCC family thiol-disulfide oxidoreductase YuxK